MSVMEEARARDHEARARAVGSDEEALRHAISAAEAYMKAVTGASSPAEKARLKQQCAQMIAFAERLKKILAGAAVPAAAIPGPVPEVMRRSPIPGRATRSSSDHAAPPAPPVQSRRLPAAEEAILLRSSRLHGNIFPIWESAPPSDAFRLSSSGGRMYSDSSDFPLSQTQLEIFAGWKRPSELFSGASSGHCDKAQGLPAASDSDSTYDNDLVQDITTDCSVVASLCAAMKHLRARGGGGGGGMLSDLMYPGPFDAGMSTSENGRLVFRMYFNGCFRRVTIDDRLPSSRTSRTLFVVDRKNPQLLWPALMEKAYLKVRGGYDFPGSNSGTDLWVLTGWIPEQIFLHTDDVEPDQIWSRIRRAYEYGDVVVTLGTGRLSREEEETLGLAGEHDYAVMDLRADGGVGGGGGESSRRMLVKNPWCDGLVWKGVGSSASTVSTPSSPSGSQPQPLSADGMTGTFWIAFEDVVQNFESLYLNWNPALFTHRQDHHFTWEMPDAAMANSFAQNPQYSVAIAGSAAIAAASGADAGSSTSIWAVLSRHFQDDELRIARNRASVSWSSASSSSPGVSSSLGFISLYVFCGTSGTRIQLPDRPRPLHRGHFVDSPQTLVRFEARRGERYTISAAQSGLPLPRYSFTLSLFSRCRLEVAKAADEHPHRESLAGSWTRRSAGGNSAEPTYLCNPQYSLRVASPTPLSLLLCADNPDLPVHVALLYGGDGGYAASSTARDIVASSGEYRRGSALCTVSHASPTSSTAGNSPLLKPGRYTVVLSTFEPGQLASYTLEVGSSSPNPVVITSAPRTGAAAGRLRTTLPPVPTSSANSASTAGAAAADSRPTLSRSSSGGNGPVVHRRRHRAPLAVSRLTRVSVSAAPRSGGLDSVRVALEAGAATGVHRRVLAESHGTDGEFGDAARGARTAEVDVDPEWARREGGLWLVVEQAGSAASGAAAAALLAPAAAAAASSAATLVEVLSDNPIQVGAWEFVED